ncbi:helix-turn-helix transcriptional regulator [Pseudomonas wadenswilerensis]|uniref:HTH cro/C1-type domain-containing protein n=2 Tax=Pseudomonas wadenswilerensis TaxID=1785161 RepID=A0A380T4N0_9PSED|nr:hypothetical protein CCOS864_04240 [Pseudomonas wadenswilerensis]
MMNNFDIAQQIAEDAELFGYARRAAPVFEIRRLMQDKGLKNIDIAERLGVSEANVSRWLRGDQNLKLDTIHSLADAVAEKLNIYFGESQVRSALADMRFSDPEPLTIVAGFGFNDEDYGFRNEALYSANDEEYGFARGEVEANEGCFAVNY